MADYSGLGIAGGALLIGSLLALVVLAYYFTHLSHVLLFWVAFVLTRPFGTTFGDLLTKPLAKHGLGFGTQGSSLTLFALLVILVAYTTWRPHRADLANPRPLYPKGRYFAASALDAL
ncbi:hypothetical protein [Hymenobacter sp. UYP22]|uniref:hypothetical protein n=1 Tax=Hymenobacter sp. UYP22 TaxID=3156348 RepID=UPI0004E05317|nr:hypothetical protein N008_21710 [Hymenobacter sp. APR13]